VVAAGVTYTAYVVDVTAMGQYEAAQREKLAMGLPGCPLRPADTWVGGRWGVDVDVDVIRTCSDVEASL
jgi:hypothetical protein